jgi:RNA polymerase sigma-70 factor (ECF subfamily)
MFVFIVLPDIATEDRLLAQARLGDQLAMMRIYDAYFQPVYEYIRMRVGDAMTAEDLASDVFVKLLNSLRGKSPPKDSLRGWLFRVARSEIADHYGAKSKMSIEALEDWVSAPRDQQPEVAFMGSYSRQQTQSAVAQLVEEQQEVLILRFGQLLSLQETADIMGKSVSAIKSLQWRAVEALRRVLTGVAEEGA